METFLTPEDQEQIANCGISKEQIHSQLAKFQSGAAFITLKKPATIGDGIFSPSEIQKSHFIKKFKESLAHTNIENFVPASGAATRMFKNLFPFISKKQWDLSPEEREENDRFLDIFIQGLQNRQFPFSDDLKDFIQSFEKKETKQILDCLLSPNGLNYGQLPKALIKFHQYPQYSRTPMEEHVVDGISLVEGMSMPASLHFTITREHEGMIKEHLSLIKERYKSTDTPLITTWSFQEDNTATLAVDPENIPVRDQKGQLVFRPGGHGALIQNLNNRTNDIIFIKNIDNVVHHHIKKKVLETKMMMGGYLISIQALIFSFLKKLHGNDITDKIIDEIIGFIQSEIGIPMAANIGDWTVPRQVDYLIDKLNRPVRVCGMVRNQGEPGGGPFWITSPESLLSLQIVETAQIDTEDPEQRKILNGATHFNPVDMVCGIKNFKGENFDLHRFIDQDTFFISEKSIQGSNIKALELPGLWNGSMAHWITLMIEIPLETFNPVKTINDLLRVNHQPK